MRAYSLDRKNGESDAKILPLASIYALEFMETHLVCQDLKVNDYQKQDDLSTDLFK